MEYITSQFFTGRQSCNYVPQNSFRHKNMTNQSLKTIVLLVIISNNFTIKIAAYIALTHVFSGYFCTHIYLFRK